MSLSETNLETGRAYRIKLAFQEIYNEPPALAEKKLESWYSWAIRSRIKEIKTFARTVKEHWNGILQWFSSRITDGRLEGINSLIQAAKAKAKGYSNPEYLKTIIYLTAGGLELQSTHTK